MAVVVLRWPEEEREAQRLRSQGIAHLLLVAPDAPPPDRDNALEDWVRMPAEHRDIVARMAALEVRASRLPSRPELDAAGRLSFRGRWVALSPIEREMTSLLVAQYGDLVSAQQLVSAGWREARPSRNAVRVHLTRLRQRLAPLGLKIVNVRQHGFVLQELSNPGSEAIRPTNG